jgi:glutamate dehydrogenase/leucine dehydrogenase
MPTPDRPAAQLEGRRLRAIVDPTIGLRAILAIDDARSGWTAGGTRTRQYETELEAVRDAAGLARAMTLKSAIAGLSAGGAKMVILETPGMDRAAVFQALGKRVQ